VNSNNSRKRRSQPETCAITLKALGCFIHKGTLLKLMLLEESVRDGFV
jgi:hypothetical protein